MYIYILKNRLNNKWYIGQSVNPPTNSSGRIYKHLNGLSPSCTAIHNAIQKYGKDTFSAEVISYPGVSQPAINAIEKWYIQKYKTISPHGYNLRDGGDSGGIPCPESRKKMSEVRKGTRPWNKGKTYNLSEESAARKRKSYTQNREITQDFREKMSAVTAGEKNGFYGKKHSEESKKKMSHAQSGEKSHQYRHDLDNSHILILYNQGYSAYHIGKLYNCCPKTITQRIQSTINIQSEQLTLF